jgi:hypothetical protein
VRLRIFSAEIDVDAVIPVVDDDVDDDKDDK